MQFVSLTASCGAHYGGKQRESTHSHFYCRQIAGFVLFLKAFDLLQKTNPARPAPPYMCSLMDGHGARNHSVSDALKISVCSIQADLCVAFCASLLHFFGLLRLLGLFWVGFTTDVLLLKKLDRRLFASGFIRRWSQSCGMKMKPKSIALHRSWVAFFPDPPPPQICLPVSPPLQGA